MKKSIASNSFSTLIRQAISILIQLVTVIIIARSLGVEGNGQYAMVILIPTFMALFLSLGLNSSAIYITAKDLYDRHTTYSTLFFSSMFIIVFGLVLGVILIKFSDALFPSMDEPHLYISLLAFPFMFINGLNLSFLQAVENFRVYNSLSLMQPILLFISIIILWIVDMIFLESILFVLIGSSFISSIIIFRFIYLDGFAIKFTSFSRACNRFAFGYGLKSHVSDIVAFINYRADIFLLNIYSTIGSVGIYAIAIQLVERMWIFSQAVSTVIYPRLSNMQDNDPNRQLLISKAFRVVILLTFIISLILVVIGNYLIVLLFGFEYSDAYYVILFLIPGVLFGAGSRILANAIAAKGKPEYNMYTSVSVMFLNIILNIILIPKYGIYGASIATSIAYTVNAILRLWMIKRLEHDLNIYLFIPKISDFSYLYIKVRKLFLRNL